MSRKSQATLYEGVNETIWHYTRLDSLFQIITNANLRATHFSKLNDTTEMIVADKTSREKLLRAFPSHADLINSDELRDELRNPTFPFVISFSNDGDVLSMWRGYGGAIDSREGVAIGFNAYDLKELADQQNAFGPIQCTYSDDALIGRLKTEEKYRTDNYDPSNSLEVSLKIHGLSRKNRSFFEEKEVRILTARALPTLEQIFQNNLGYEHQYFSLVSKDDPLAWPLAIKELRAGPKTSEDRLRLYASLLPDGGERVSISRSKAPFK